MRKASQSDQIFARNESQSNKLRTASDPGGLLDTYDVKTYIPKGPPVNPPFGNVPVNRSGHVDRDSELIFRGQTCKLSNRQDVLLRPDVNKLLPRDRAIGLNDHVIGATITDHAFDLNTLPTTSYYEFVGPRSPTTTQEWLNT